MTKHEEVSYYHIVSYWKVNIPPQNKSSGYSPSYLTIRNKYNYSGDLNKKNKTVKFPNFLAMNRQ